jgi:hypothetical protein
VNRGGGPQHAVPNHNNRETRLNTVNYKSTAKYGLRSQFVWAIQQNDIDLKFQ